MEIAKYLCEFFFCNFWHWLGLFLIVFALFGGGLIPNIKITDNSINKEEKDADCNKL